VENRTLPPSQAASVKTAAEIGRVTSSEPQNCGAGWGECGSPRAAPSGRSEGKTLYSVPMRKRSIEWRACPVGCYQNCYQNRASGGISRTECCFSVSEKTGNCGLSALYLKATSGLEIRCPARGCGFESHALRCESDTARKCLVFRHSWAVGVFSNGSCPCSVPVGFRPHCRHRAAADSNDAARRYDRKVRQNRQSSYQIELAGQ
jgi:hypothetical protein